MSDKWEIKPPHILDDRPENENLFLGHKRVGDAIVNLIMEQEGGKAIALTGSWGSGKSSVIRYIKKVFEKRDEENIRVFEFDAWEHRGDPLRRSFLEALVSNLVEDKDNDQRQWVKTKKWNKKKKSLSERKARSESRPDLKPLGLLFAFTVALATLGLGILSKLDYFAELSDYAVFSLIVPAGIIAAIVVFKLIECSYHLIRGHGNYKSFFVLATNQADTSTEVIEHLGSTSVEFSEFYEEILRETLDEYKNRRLLIVVDNLDRIEPEQARDVWSTMLTFFSLVSTDRPDWQKRLWLIVPYDACAVEELWDDIECLRCAEKSTNSRRGGLSQHFEEKTFQTFFHVPPLVISEIDEYLMEQFKNVFNNVKFEDATLHKVCRVFELGRERPDWERMDKENDKKDKKDQFYSPRDLPNPTPREVKLFLNKLSAIYRQWGGRISIPVQALYAIKDKSNWWSKARLMENDNDILGRLTSYLLDPNWKTQLAMIYLGVEEGKTFELLYHDIIYDALISGQAQELMDYELKDGFYIVLNYVVYEYWEIWYKQEQAFLAKAIITLEGFKPFPESTVPLDLKSSWEQLFEGFKMAPIWPKLDQEMAKGVLIFLRYNPGREDSASIIEAISRTDYSFHNVSDKRDKRLDFLGGLLTVIAFVHDNYPDVLKEFRLNTPPSEYLQLMAIVASMDIEPEIKALFRLKDDKHLQGSLKQQASDGIPQELASGFEEIRQIYADLNWGAIQDEIMQFLTKKEPKQTPYVAGSLYTILDLAKKPLEDDPFLATLVNSGVLYSFLNYQGPIPQEDSLSAALCVYIMHVVGTEGAPEIDKSLEGFIKQGFKTYPALMQNPDNNPMVVEEYAKLLAKYHSSDNSKVLREIFEHYDKGESKPFARAVIKELALRPDSNRFFSAGVIWRFYYRLEGELPEVSFTKLISKAYNDGNLTDELMTSVGFSSIRPLLYLDILNRAPTNEQYVKFLVENLKAVSLHSFIDDYGDGRRNPGSDKRMQRDYPLLLIRLVELGNEHFIDDDSFVDLIATWMKQSYDEKGQLPPALQGKEETLLKAFTPEARKRFLDQMGPEWDKYK